MPMSRRGSTSTTSHYDVLGVPRTASTQEIRQVYRKKVLACHPDKNASQEHVFKAITEAYEVIGDDSKRALYDMQLDADLSCCTTDSLFENFGSKGCREGGDSGMTAPFGSKTNMMSRAQREAFRKEEDDLMRKILEEDRMFVARTRKEKDTSREDFEAWCKHKARELSGEDSRESVEKRAAYEQERAREKAEQSARRQRLQEIEDELQVLKEAERLQKLSDAQRRQSRLEEYDTMKKEIFGRIAEEEYKFSLRMKELERKWKDKYQKSLERLPCSGSSPSNR